MKPWFTGIKANTRTEWWLRALFLGHYRPTESKKDAAFLVAMYGSLPLALYARRKVRRWAYEQEARRREMERFFRPAPAWDRDDIIEGDRDILSSYEAEGIEAFFTGVTEAHNRRPHTTAPE